MIRKRKKIKISVVVAFGVLTLFAFLQVFPYFLKLMESLNSRDFMPEYNKFYLFPHGMEWSNYLEVIKKAGLLTGLKNSLIVVVSFTVLTLFIAFLMGYVLGKMKFRGRNVVFLLLLSTMMVPGEILLIPNYILVTKMGMYDKLIGVIFPGAINIFGIFLFRQFMNTIPEAVLESARVDGANEFRKIFQIVLPMCIPIVITYIIMTFTASWNEYLWPRLVLKSGELFTLQLSMFAFFPRYPNSAADTFVRSAGMILITLPIITIYIFCQKYFLQSINTAGIK